MSHLEIIQIRTAKTNQKLLNDFLSAWLNQVNESKKTEKIKIYKRINLETDYSIHIELKAKTDKDQIGEKLASTLKEFGIVNYSVWVEQLINNNKR